MNFLKKHKYNILFLALILILFFTPIGFQVKVLMNRYVNFSPTEIPQEKRVTLANYNWSLKSDTGNKIDFNQFRDQVIVLNFWATWCPPCVAEMPSFQDLYEDYNSEVVFLFVANDKAKKVHTFMREQDYSFPNYYENSITPPELVSNSLPTTYIINKKGDIVMKKKGAYNWNSEYIREQLNQLIQE